MNKESVSVIAFDGGPSGGKTSGMNRVVQALTQVGIIPVVVPEAATLLISGGFLPSEMGIEAFQRLVVPLQMSNERIWMAGARSLAARHKKRTVLLCDRGILSSAAYLPGNNRLNSLNSILAEFGMNAEKAREGYVGVVHLVTAAQGAERFYTLDNNTARTETPDRARMLDARTIEAWLGHPHLAIVANVDRITRKQISFEEKMRRAVAEVFRILGYPQPLEIEDKYLICNFDPILVPVKCEAIGIVQTYLMPNDARSEERVRLRKWLDIESYYHTIKLPAANGARIEIERSVMREEYEKLLKRADANCAPIKKTRYCFVWNSQYFEVDVFEGRHKGLFLLERERTDMNDSTVLPPFINVVRDVTRDERYKNRALAAA